MEKNLNHNSIITSKPWSWENVTDNVWHTPEPICYYLINRWKMQNKTAFLDIGCGLGRHSFFFAENGFKVNAFDLSDYAVCEVEKNIKKFNFDINLFKGDIIDLKLPTESIDCMLAFMSLNHTDTQGFKKTLNDINRILKKEGEIFFTIPAKNSRLFTENVEKLDKNSVVFKDEGPEKGIPHFFANESNLKGILSDFEIINIDYVKKVDLKRKNFTAHYFILAKKRT